MVHAHQQQIHQLSDRFACKLEEAARKQLDTRAHEKEMAKKTEQAERQLKKEFAAERSIEAEKKALEVEQVALKYKEKLKQVIT